MNFIQIDIAKTDKDKTALTIFSINGQFTRVLHTEELPLGITQEGINLRISFLELLFGKLIEL